MNASIVLLPGAAKRLIAKGVAALPLVRHAMERGRIVVTLGTTNAYVAEELLGRPIDRTAYAAGFVGAEWNINSRLGETAELVLEKGVPVEWEPETVLASLKAEDVVIKGGNALDPWGTVGVLLGSAGGGTVGRYAAPAYARGVHLVLPVSLAKSVHTSIADLALKMGSGKAGLRMGLSCGLFPLHGHVVTELEAIRLLCGAEAYHVASGGVGAGTGSVSLVLDGSEEDVRRGFDVIQSIADEPDIQLEGRL